MIDIRSTTAQALRWSGGTRLVAQGISWASTLVVIRLLHPEDYGLMAMVTSVLLLTSYINEVGLTASLVQARQLGAHEIAAVIGLTWAVNIAIFAILFAAAPLASVYFGKDITTLLRVAALSVPLRAFGRVQESLLIRDMDFRRRAIVETSSLMTGTVATLTLAFVGYGVWSLVLGALADAVARALGYTRAVAGRWRPSLDLRSALPHLRFGGAVVAQRTISWIYKQIDIVLLGRLYSAEALGLYATAKELANLPSGKLASIVNPIVFTAFARLQEDPARVRRALLTSFGYLALITFPLFALASALADELRTVFLGDRWAGLETPLSLLCLIVPLRMMATQLGEALNGIGRPRVQVYNYVILTIFIVPAVIVGAQYSPNGVALAIVLAFPPGLAVAAHLSSRYTGASLAAIGATVGKPFFAAVLMYAAVMIARQLGIDETLPPAIRLGLLVAIATLVYGTILLGVDRRRCVDLVSFLLHR